MVKNINRGKTNNVFSRLDFSKEEQGRDFCIENGDEEMYAKSPEKKLKILMGKTVEITNI